MAELFLEHLRLSGGALLIALPTGVLIVRYRVLYTPLLGTLGIIYTIPSLALLAMLAPSQGIGVKTALIALVAYAQLILVATWSRAYVASIPPCWRRREAWA